MGAAVANTPKALQQGLHYYLPRWMGVFVVNTLTQELVIVGVGSLFAMSASYR
jgi:hypothetical protein